MAEAPLADVSWVPLPYLCGVATVGRGKAFWLGGGRYSTSLSPASPPLRHPRGSPQSRR